MSPRTKAQFEQIRAGSRRAILDAAFQLFTSRSVGGTTIADIAQDAGISKGLVYNYFKSKDEILRAVVEEALGPAITALKKVDEIKDPVEQLRFVIRESVGVAKANPQLWRLLFQLFFQPGVSSTLEPTLLEMRSWSVQKLTTIFQRLGVHDPVTDAFILGVQLDGLVLNYVLSQQEFPIDEITDHLIQHYCSTPHT